MNDAATDFLLIRHAHADTGAGGRICGWFDVPLSVEGQRQLDRFTIERAAGQPAALHSSPLTRARQTALALGAAWSLPVAFDPGLREVFCGDFEGRCIADVKRDHAAIWTRNATQTDADFAWPAGESYRQFRTRIHVAFTRIAARHRGQDVAVVTHTGVITQLIGILNDRTAAAWEHHRASPFSATIIRWRNDRPEQLLSFDVRTWWRKWPLPVG